MSNDKLQGPSHGLYIIREEFLPSIILIRTVKINALCLELRVLLKY